MESNRFSAVVLNEAQARLEAIHELDLPNYDPEFLKPNCPLLESEYKRSMAFFYPVSGTLLPKFSEEKLNELSAIQMQKSEGQEFRFSQLGTTGLSLSSLILVEEKELLAKAFTFTSLESFSKSFVLSNQMKSKLEGKLLLAWHISPQSSMVGVFNAGEILFYNQFNLSNTEDLLYYTLNILDELKITTSSISVLLSGRIQTLSLQKELISEYLDHWKYTDEIDGLSLNYLSEAARIRNFTLLNSFRCV